jgi:predicted nucleic acid-binding protein
MILVDTSVWIDYFNGGDNIFTEELDLQLSKGIVVIGDLILAEILQGFRKDNDFQLAKDSLDALVCFNIVSRTLAVKSAENFRLLRKKGITVRKTTDMLIGTFCIENKISLLYQDRDFDPLKTHLGLTSVI